MGSKEIKLEKILRFLEENNKEYIIDELSLPSSEVVSKNRNQWFMVENILIKQIKRIEDLNFEFN